MEGQMPRNDAPLSRSIGLTGLIRWIIAATAVIAIGGAFAAGRIALGVAGSVFLVAAILLGYRAWRARQEARPDDPGGTP